MRVTELFAGQFFSFRAMDLEGFEDCLTDVRSDVAILTDRDSSAPLLEELGPCGTVVVDVDHEDASRVKADVRQLGSQALTFSVSGAPADLVLLSQDVNESGELLVVSLFGQTHYIQLPWRDDPSARDVLAAIGTAVANGVDVYSATLSIERASSLTRQTRVSDREKVLPLFSEVL
jgi:hypothetical protein